MMNLEKEINEIKLMLIDIYNRLIMGEAINARWLDLDDEERKREYNQAIVELKKGNKKPLEKYLKKYGKLPQED